MKKRDVSDPLVISQILANQGLTNNIPQNASEVEEQYNASQDVGFPAITMRPISAGGEAPDGKDFNGFLQLLSSHLFASQNGGVYTFSQGVSTAIGGYPQGAILSYIDNDGNFSLVQSLIDDNAYDFVSTPSYIDGEKWQEIKLGGSGGGLEIGDIGIASLPIDETQLKRKYLNGQTILQSEFVAFTSKLKSAIQTYPNLACTESEWRDIVANSKVGQCGKFVVDDVNGTIRLPKVVRIQGQLTLANIGDIVDEKLPNITAWNSARIIGDKPNAGGAYGGMSASSNAAVAGGSGLLLNVYMAFNASYSSSTYQDNAPVQEEAVQYPYFIQLANGTEEEIDPVREIEFNNPFYFGTYKWSEFIPDNLSWLASDGTFKNGTVYTDFYNWILANKSGSIVSGISVKSSDEAYDDYDFVVNETNGTFRTPLDVKSASGSAIVGNKTDNTGLTLYWYVGETVQNANLINAAAIVSSKADTDAGNFTQTGKSQITKWSSPSSRKIILTTGASGTSYTAPANGYFYISTGAAINIGFALWNHESKGYIEQSAAPTTIAVNLISKVDAGEVVKLDYVNLPSVVVSFIYAEGDENV